MRMLDLQNKDLVCEVCGENIHNPKTVGVESDERARGRFDFVIVVDPSTST